MELAQLGASAAPSEVFTLVSSLPDQILGIRRRVDATRDEIEQNLESASPDLAMAVEELLRAVELLHGFSIAPKPFFGSVTGVP